MQDQSLAKSVSNKIKNISEDREIKISNLSISQSLGFNFFIDSDEDKISKTKLNKFDIFIYKNDEKLKFYYSNEGDIKSKNISNVNVNDTINDLISELAEIDKSKEFNNKRLNIPSTEAEIILDELDFKRYKNAYTKYNQIDIKLLRVDSNKNDIKDTILSSINLDELLEILNSNKSLTIPDFQNKELEKRIKDNLVTVRSKICQLSSQELRVDDELLFCIRTRALKNESQNERITRITEQIEKVKSGKIDLESLEIIDLNSLSKVASKKYKSVEEFDLLGEEDKNIKNRSVAIVSHDIYGTDPVILFVTTRDAKLEDISISPINLAQRYLGEIEGRVRFNTSETEFKTEFDTRPYKFKTDIIDFKIRNTASKEYYNPAFRAFKIRTRINTIKSKYLFGNINANVNFRIKNPKNISEYCDYLISRSDEKNSFIIELSDENKRCTTKEKKEESQIKISIQELIESKILLNKSSKDTISAQSIDEIGSISAQSIDEIGSIVVAQNDFLIATINSKDIEVADKKLDINESKCLDQKEKCKIAIKCKDCSSQDLLKIDESQPEFNKLYREIFVADKACNSISKNLREYTSRKKLSWLYILSIFVLFVIDFLISRWHPEKPYNGIKILEKIGKIKFSNIIIGEKYNFSPIIIKYLKPILNRAQTFISASIGTGALRVDAPKSPHSQKYLDWDYLFAISHCHGRGGLLFQTPMRPAPIVN